jgi:hypothetical protein
MNVLPRNDMSADAFLAKDRMVPRDIVIRAVNPMSLAVASRQRIWEVNRDQPMSKVATVDDILDTEARQDR